ncbi:MAG: CvpA family protein [Pseudomonadota bacterium]|nr:CvpA family protein [Pseudomonadota bacterium]
MPFSWLDIILAAIMLISGFLAMLRGLTREVLSILSWAVAALATLYLFPKYQSQARLYVEPALLADALLAAGIFLVVLIIVSLITVRVSDRVLDSRVGALDRTLGFVFGLARGLVLVVIAYLFFSWLVPEEQQPQWIKEARSLPILRQTGDAIVSLLPEDPAAHLPGAAGGSGDKPQPDAPATPAGPRTSIDSPAKVTGLAGDSRYVAARSE